LINYDDLARVRRELENILLLVDELESKGVPKEVITNLIKNESEKLSSKNERVSKDQQDGA
jgi:hypothetical protein